MVGKAIFNFAALANCPHSRVNYFEIAQSRQGKGGLVWPDYCDANGYPISDLPSAISFQVATEDLNLNHTGNWIIKWTGKLGSMNVSPGTANFSVSSGIRFTAQVTTTTITFAGTNGRVVWKCGNQFNTMPFTFNAGAVGWDGTLDNLVLIREADEAAYDAGQRWRKEYLDYLKYINPEGLRFLNWQPINNEIMTRWNQRTRESEFIYASDRVPLSSWARTLSGEHAYTCDKTPDTPIRWTDHECFYAYVATPNIADNPTIDCGTRGVKPLRNYNQTFLATGELISGFYTFMYDQVHDSVAAFKDLINQACPPEICIDLCNQTNTNLYMCIPPFVDDDYVTQLVTLIRTTLKPGLKCTLELGNEFWNIFSFVAGHYYGKRGVTLGLNSDQNYAMLGMVGLRTRQVMELATAAWSPRTRNELVRATAMQIQGSITNAQTYQFNGENLGTYGYKAAPNRPIDWCDAVAGAPYIEAAQFKQYDGQYAAPLLSPKALYAADDYDSGVSKRMEAAIAWLDNDIRRGIFDGSRWYTTLDALFEDYLPPWNTVVRTYGKLLIGYEGGLGMVPPSTAKCTALGISPEYSAKIAALISAYKKGPYGEKLIFDYLHKWESFENFGVPAMFTNIGVDGWSMREDLYETKHGLEDGFRHFNNHATVLFLRSEP